MKNFTKNKSFTQMRNRNRIDHVSVTEFVFFYKKKNSWTSWAVSICLGSLIIGDLGGRSNFFFDSLSGN